MNGTLTARRKADRAKMARQVAGAAEVWGIAARITWELPGSRYTSVELEGQHGLRLAVKFDGTALDPDTYMLHWHGVEDGWWLSRAHFINVNPHHGHKATDVTAGFTQLLNVLRYRFAAIADGSAFVRAS
jgi:hypothetical protein